MPSVEQLEALLAKEPDDVFLNFGLAMALAKKGDIAGALARFDRLLAIDSRYVPAYFQKGRLLAQTGDPAAARVVLEQGITVAGAAGDRHALGEMAEFLASL